MENSTRPAPNRARGSPRPGISTLASMTSGSPSCGQVATKPPPRGDTTPGSVHIATSIAAMAASTAVPPASTRWRPARTAMALGAAMAAVTEPIVPRVGGPRLTGPMKETQEELAALQGLLDRSHAGASDHLRSIIDDDRTLRAREITGLMTGMRVLSFATVTALGEPRVSALDGHFLHGHWTMSTLRSSHKGRQMTARPAVSAACIEGEEVAVFAHGQAVVLEGEELVEVDAHWTAHYGSSPMSWGDVVMARLEAAWMVGYVSNRSEVLAKRGVPEEERPVLR